MQESRLRNHALDFLKVKVAGIRGSRLPNLNDLAREAGVSRVTMHKAVRELAASGLLKCSPRTGIQVVKGDDSNLRDAPLSGRSRTIRQTIERDILEGAYGHDRLPSLKELCARYGAAFRTIKKAVADLEQCRIIRRSLTHYALVKPELLSDSGKILLYVDPDFIPSLEAGFMAARALGFLSQLESICAERRVRFEIVHIGDRAALAPRFADARGALIWASTQDSFSFAADLVLREKPVVIVDIIGEFEIPDSFLRARSLTIYRIADEAAGAMVGRHLLHLGHRRIAYFSYHHGWNLPYTLSRYRGVRKAFEDAGLSSEQALLFAFQPPRSDARSFAAGTQQPVRQAIRRARDRFLKVDAPQSIRDAIVTRLQESDFFLELGQTMGPCFEAALADHSITAWIAEGDTLAAHAVLPFLKGRGVAVPGRISVAAFESTALSIQAGLTVADFRIHSCARAAVEEILRPSDRRQRRDQAKIQEIMPLVVERGSCGKRPGSGVAPLH